MNLKGTGDIFRLLIKLLYCFITDRAYFKKLILHSGREFWYLVMIVILSAMIASLIGQLYLTKLEVQEPRICPIIENNESKPIIHKKESLCDKPEVPNPEPRNSIVAPLPKTPERREHNLDLLLDDIR